MSWRWLDRRWPGALLFVLLACATTLPAAGRETFSETADVVAVEVPVNVLVGGQPVRGLSAENFVVYDRRKKQEITGFSVVDLAARPADDSAEGELMPLASRRHFLLLFDLSFSRPSSIIKARRAALEIVQQRLHPSDLVAVGSYTLVRGPQLIVGFTPDRAQVARAIETLGLPQLVRPVGDPLGLLLESIAENAANSRFGDELAEQLGQFALFNDQGLRAIDVGNAASFSNGMADLAKLLRGVVGRKQIVLLSEGFEASVFMGTASHERHTAINQAAATGQYWDVDSQERYGDATVLTVIEDAIRDLRLADCVVQSVDVGGIRTAELAGDDSFRSGAIPGAGNENSLFIMANETGGELFRNFNELDDAMGRLLDHTSVTYVLSFQPQKLEPDGDFHKLRVELVGGPPGAELLHRPGYYAPRPWAELSPDERRLDAADRIVRGIEGGALEISALATPFAVAGGRPYVPLLLEIDGPTLLAERRGKRLRLEVYAYAFRLDGTAADYLSEDLTLDLDQVGTTLAATGTKLFAHFDLDPGSYQLRVLVRESSSGRSSVRVLPLRVPALDGSEPALSPALVAEPPGKWVMVRETPRPERVRNVVYPFLRAGEPFIPAAQPVLSATTPTELCFFTRHAGAERSRLEAEWVDERGAPLGRARLELVERAAEPGTDRERLVARLDPAGLGEGRYRLETRLSAADGSKPLVSSTWVAVRP